MRRTSALAAVLSGTLVLASVLTAAIAPGLRAETAPSASPPPASAPPASPPPAAAPPASASAPETAEAMRVMAAMRLDELFAIMAEEGLAYGADLREIYFAGRAAPGFEAAVERAYAPERLQADFAAAFAAELAADPAAAATTEAFYAAPVGQRIIELELLARRALLDDDLREAAEVKAEKMQAARDPRLRAIRRLIEAGDLIEGNTAGSMTVLAAFSLALNATAPVALRQSEADVLAGVWADEARIRADTAEWLFSFMALAYAPLSDAELKAYGDFLASPAGQVLNRAVLAGSEAALRPALADLGREVGLVLRGRDI